MAKFMVTGGAGFIGSHICEFLIDKGHEVIVYDNLSTGNLENLSVIKGKIQFIKGDICDYNTLFNSMKGVDFIIHHAAEISVFKSLEDPVFAANVNVMGTINVLQSAKENKVKRCTLASSSAIYGDTGTNAQKENFLPKPISPYGASKICDEYYYSVFSQIYDIETVVLRYFNVFGPRQNPKSQYAAVIPIFIDKIIQNKEIYINGDGNQTRDFVFVKNVAMANYLACTVPNISGEVFNIASNNSITINQLAEKLLKISGKDVKIIHKEPIIGDIRYSVANIDKAQLTLGYNPEISFDNGLKITYNYFCKSYL